MTEETLELQHVNQLHTVRTVLAAGLCPVLVSEGLTARDRTWSAQFHGCFAIFMVLMRLFKLEMWHFLTDHILYTGLTSFPSPKGQWPPSPSAEVCVHLRRWGQTQDGSTSVFWCRFYSLTQWHMMFMSNSDCITARDWVFLYSNTPE